MLACACVWLGAIAARADLAVVPKEINTFQQFYSLASEQASQGVPVKIKGVVVCYDQGWNQLYIHDGAETVWFTPRLFQNNLQAGLAVELTGSTTFGQGNVTFSNLHLQIFGKGKIPDAKRLEIPQLGSDHGQWVETEGRVRVAETSPGRLGLIVQDKGQTCLVYVMGLPATNNYRWALLGCDVRIRGINASKTVDGRLTAASIFAPGLNEVNVLERPTTQPSDLPVISVKRCAWSGSWGVNQ